MKSLWFLIQFFKHYITSMLSQSTSVSSAYTLGGQHSLLHRTCFESSHSLYRLINLVLCYSYRDDRLIGRPTCRMIDLSNDRLIERSTYRMTYFSDVQLIWWSSDHMIKTLQEQDILLKHTIETAKKKFHRGLRKARLRKNSLNRKLDWWKAREKLAWWKTRLMKS